MLSPFHAGTKRHEEAEGEIGRKHPETWKNIIPEVVDQRTLQICHIEATHCIVFKTINDHN
jgi:hypothetical protein